MSERVLVTSIPDNRVDVSKSVDLNNGWSVPVSMIHPTSLGELKECIKSLDYLPGGSKIGELNRFETKLIKEVRQLTKVRQSQADNKVFDSLFNFGETQQIVSKSIETGLKENEVLDSVFPKL